MAISSGTRIGPYEISSLVGAGGMGEVFRAVDVNLGRAAAIKVLPASLAANPERLMRFEREAQTLAALNHPNIAQVFGFEKGEGSFRALAMEFVEGPTLADRVAAGPIPADEAIPIALQIADALESAHDHGIVHRDLKPLNIKVRPDGVVKVLDFGLAKAIAPAAESSAGAALDSPTITTPAMTHAGVVLGTASYMSPEQARGRAVDRRADIWAFGCVLFEMLTGRRAFAGPEISDVVVAILRDEPPWSALPGSTPSQVQWLLRRCLQKDVRQRLPHIGLVRFLLGEPSLLQTEPEPLRSSRTVWRAVAAAAVVSMLAAAGWAIWGARPDRITQAPVRVRIDAGAGNEVLLGGATALSPDGSVLAFVGRPPGNSLRTMLYVRHLDRLDAEELPGTDGAQLPFFSPDGAAIAFFAGETLRKVPTSGGPIVSIAPAPVARGGSWGDDDAIVFASLAGLSRVPGSGGTPEVIVPREADDPPPSSPQVLPRGRGILFVRAANSDPAAGTLLVHDSATGTTREILQGGRSPGYTASGHLTFVRSGTLFAAPFDLDALALRETAAPVLEGVYQTPFNPLANLALSPNGTLVYQPVAAAQARQVPLVWLSQTGALTPLRSVPATYGFPRFSPDGRRVAMSISDGRQLDIWVYDWERDILNRITTDPGADLSPVWTPDGSGLIFGSNRNTNVLNLYWQKADGTGDAHRLTTSNSGQLPNAFDSEGTLLIFHEGDPATTRQELRTLPIVRDANQPVKAATPTTLIGGPFLKSNARISPDGKWMAYAANDTGEFEIYVQPFPALGERVQVSNSGGNLALWSPRNDELYYARSGEGLLMVVPYAVSGGRFVPGRPQPWSQTAISASPPVDTYGPGFDLHPDGTRFAVAPPQQPAADAARADQLVLVFNFFDELRRVAPNRR